MANSGFNDPSSAHQRSISLIYSVSWTFIPSTQDNSAALSTYSSFCFQRNGGYARYTISFSWERKESDMRRAKVRIIDAE